jgi:hypothetical protein
MIHPILPIFAYCLQGNLDLLSFHNLLFPQFQLATEKCLQEKLKMINETWFVCSCVLLQHTLDHLHQACNATRLVLRK